MMEHLLAHIAFPLFLGLTAHFTVEPGARRWHRTLRKSGWTPPPVAFPFVWLVSYANLGFASYRAAKAGAGRVQAAAYVLHVIAVNVWNPVFFVTRRLRVAAGLLGVIVVTTPILLVEVALWDALAALVLLPYYAWLLLMAHLSAYMAAHNPGPHFGAVKDEVIRMHERAACKSD